VFHFRHTKISLQQLEAKQERTGALQTLSGRTCFAVYDKGCKDRIYVFGIATVHVGIVVHIELRLGVFGQCSSQREDGETKQEQSGKSEKCDRIC
jgi:hypothetical protein